MATHVCTHRHPINTQITENDTQTHTSQGWRLSGEAALQQMSGWPCCCAGPARLHQPIDVGGYKWGSGVRRERGWITWSLINTQQCISPVFRHSPTAVWNTHIWPASKAASLRFVEGFLLSLQIQHLTLLTCWEGAPDAVPKVSMILHI